MAKKPRTVRIRLREGRMPTSAIQFAPGGGVRPRVLTPETSHEVIYNSFIRRRLRRGDFELTAEAPPKREAPKRPARKADERKEG